MKRALLVLACAAGALAAPAAARPARLLSDADMYTSQLGE
jgi:hypothetical protein